jgi:hypothetical protein
MDASVEKQTEINEWSYNSKRETLFFFQLVFIGLTILIIMYSMVSAGILNNIFVLYVMIIMVVVLGLIWYTKTTYTRSNRDKTHWNKLVFPEDGKKPSTLSPTVLNSVVTATNAACATSGSANTGGTNNIRPRISSWETNNSETIRHGDWDDRMFDGQTRGFFTDPTDPGSAAARDASGNLYGDKNSDGQLGRWDTTGSFQKFDDVSNADLNTRQGIDYNRINTGMASPVPQSSNPVEFCEKNPGRYDPISGLPCKQVWCMANPTLSWKDPSSSVTTPCKTLFSWL